jgi:hypothetical protein
VFKQVNLPHVAIILFCLVVPSLALTRWDNLSRASDFPNYYAAAKMIAAGKPKIAYDAVRLGELENQLVPALEGRVKPFLLFPVLSWIVTPLAFFPYHVALVVWTALLYAGLAAAFFVFANVFELKRMQRILAAAILGGSGPCLEAIRAAQPSSILLLGLAGVAYGIKHNRAFLAGCSQAIFLVKPHLLVPTLLYELGCRLYKIPAVTLVVSALCSIVSLVLIGLEAMQVYFSSVASPEFHATYLRIIAAPTFRGQLARLMPDTDLGTIIYGTYALVAIAALVLGMKRSGLRPLLTIVVPITLVFSPHLHIYDLLLLFPGICMLLCSPTTARSLRVLCAALIVLFLDAVYIPVHYYYVLQGGPFNPFFWGVLMLAIASLASELLPHRRAQGAPR